MAQTSFFNKHTPILLMAVVAILKGINEFWCAFRPETTMSIEKIICDDNRTVMDLYLCGFDWNDNGRLHTLNGIGWIVVGVLLIVATQTEDRHYVMPFLIRSLVAIFTWKVILISFVVVEGKCENAGGLGLVLISIEFATNIYFFMKAKSYYHHMEPDLSGVVYAP